LPFALAILAGAAIVGCGFDDSPTSLPPTDSRADLSELGPPGADAAKASRGVGGNWISHPRLFAAGQHFVSLAATPNRLLATTDGDAPTKLFTISESGEMQPFGSGLAVAPATACYVEVAPGVGDFPQDAILLGAGLDVWRIAPDGRAAVTFATLPAGDGNIAGLTFDTVGALHYDLVALTTSGAVYYIDVQGRAIRVGSVGLGGRGISVASASFGRNAGQVLVAFPAEHEVRALDPAGNLSVAIRWSGVSGAWAVPDAPRGFGDTGAALFVATDAGEIFRYPLNDLAAYGGGVLLTSSLCSGSGLTTCRSNNLTTQAFSRFMGGERAAAFVRRPAFTLVSIEILPGVSPKTIGYGSTTLVPVAILAAPGFSPRLLEGGEVRFAGADLVETPRRRTGVYQDVNADGKVDLVLRFRPAEMDLRTGDATLVLEGTALAGDRVRGTGSVRVLAQ